jgi:hypothetical protein
VSGLEAALQAQHGGGGEAEEDTVEAAQRRLRKAIALPPPELRSGAGGMSLSAGAAAAAAACRGALCDRVRRFVLAAGELPGLAEAGACAVQHCPDALGIGTRPLPYNAFAFGNRCEPLWSRGAVELVRQLADGGDLAGLEWFTGSSTSWLLARLAHLTSIEAAQRERGWGGAGGAGGVGVHGCEGGCPGAGGGGLRSPLCGPHAASAGGAGWAALPPPRSRGGRAAAHVAVRGCRPLPRFCWMRSRAGPGTLHEPPLGPRPTAPHPPSLAALADKARSVARLQFEDAWLERGWELRVVPPQGPVVSFADTESGEVWDEYCALRFLAPSARFDLVAVQGFARMACLRRAVALLPPQGGLLVLPQAQRPAYAGAAAAVPPHWLLFRDAHDMGETLVWMSMNE